jgi:hypothetical protein
MKKMNHVMDEMEKLLEHKSSAAGQ